MKKHILLLQTLIITLVSAILDVYSLFYRGGKFTFLQTGNLIYLANDIINNNMVGILLSILCLITFGIGLFIAEYTSYILRKNNKDKYTSLSLLILMIILLIPNFFFPKTIPFDLSIISTVCLNLIGGILLSQFRNYLVPFTATMMTNNYKLMVENVVKSVEYKDNNYLKKSIIYLMIIITFFIGGLLSVLLIKLMPTIIALVALSLMLLLFTLELIKIRKEVCLSENL